MQQSLLRVLQEKEIQPIGGTPQKIDVQVIAATNKDLVKMCEEGNYRWDLYYRLAVAEIEIPSLHERGPEEIEATLDYLISRKQLEMNATTPLSLDDEVRQHLIRYHYPGNIREMENIIESLYVFAEDQVNMADLPERGKVYIFKPLSFERSHAQAYPLGNRSS